jgi:hypothetical protein
MRKYLGELHRKSDSHKKRFAFLVSLSFTLLIFGVWSLVTFGPMKATEIAGGNDDANQYEVSPFSALLSGTATAIKSIKGDVNKVKEGLKSISPTERQLDSYYDGER